MQEIVDEVYHRCGVRVCEATVRRALRAQGIVRLKPTRRVYATAPKGAKGFLYTTAHRLEDVALYSTNLTDIEWELVADLFGRALGQRGTSCITADESWLTPVRRCCTQAAPGVYCRQRSDLDKPLIKLLSLESSIYCKNAKLRR